MREKELRERATCAACGRKIGHAGTLTFWTVKIERHGLKHDALERQQGLAMMLGGSGALASVMGPDEEMTTPMMEPVTATICDPCALRPIHIFQLVEAAQDEDDDDDGDQA